MKLKNQIAMSWQIKWPQNSCDIIIYFGDKKYNESWMFYTKHTLIKLVTSIPGAQTVTHFTNWSLHWHRYNQADMSRPENFDKIFDFDGVSDFSKTHRVLKISKKLVENWDEGDSLT